MKDQVHIRNAEAAHLARTYAQQTGKTVTEIVLEALRAYRPVRRTRDVRKLRKEWDRLLAQDWSARNDGPEVTIESMYDERTGLPK